MQHVLHHRMRCSACSTTWQAGCCLGADPSHVCNLQERGRLVSGQQPKAPVVFSENGVHFQADLVQGQKTGFFLDQRDNRQRIGRLARGKRVLNLFGYTGGFSMYAGGRRCWRGRPARAAAGIVAAAAQSTCCAVHVQCRPISHHPACVHLLVVACAAVLMHGSTSCGIRC
jgi:hypothetical protein